MCQNNIELFGETIDGKMVLNEAGKMVKSVWKKTIHTFSNISSDQYVIMPNHFHCIIEINNGIDVGADSISASSNASGDVNACNGGRVEMDSTPTVGTIVQTFKRYTTIRYIEGVTLGLVPAFRKRIWQRNYYDHSIRKEKECIAIEQYILNNPRNWEQDRLRKREWDKDSGACSSLYLL